MSSISPSSPNTVSARSVPPTLIPAQGPQIAPPPGNQVMLQGNTSPRANQQARTPPSPRSVPQGSQVSSSSQRQPPPPYARVQPNNLARGMMQAPGPLSVNRWAAQVFRNLMAEVEMGKFHDPMMSSEEKVEQLQNLKEKLKEIIGLAGTQHDDATISAAREMLGVVAMEELRPPEEVGHPGLHDLKPEFLKSDQLDNALKVLTNLDKGKLTDKAALDAAFKLAEMLVSQIDGSKPGTTMKFLCNDGVYFKNGILAMATKDVSLTYKNSSEQVKHFLDRMYDEIVAGLTHNKSVSPNEIHFKGRVFLSVNKPEVDRDIHFKQDGAFIARGGFGHVYLFKEAQKWDEVVIKEQFEGENEFSAAARELRNHAKALGPKGSHENIVGLLGAVSTSRCLRIGLEYCPGGTIHHFGDVLKALRKDGGLVKDNKVQKLHFTSQQLEKAIGLMQASLLKGMANGLMQMHANNISHNDFKGANAFIGSDGRAKVADFGTGVSTRKGVIKLQGSKVHETLPETPNFLAPEAIKLNQGLPLWSNLSNGLKLINAAMTGTPWDKPDLDQMHAAVAATNDFALIQHWAKIRPDLQHFIDECKREVDKSGNQKLSQTTKDLLKSKWFAPLDRLRLTDIARFKGEEVSPPINLNKADIWSLGMTAMLLIYDVNPFPGSSIEFESNVLAFADPNRLDQITDVRKKAWFKANSGANGNPPEYKLLDDLLNHMMDRDPSQRYSAEEILMDDFFKNQPQIDSQEVRQLIIALSTKNATVQQITGLLAKLNL